MKLPSKKIIDEFHLTYELLGAEKGINVLARYYGVRRMRILLDGRRVGKGDEASYFQNRAFFTKKGLTKANVLHEFYHHLVDGLELSESREEREADRFAREVLKRA